MKQATRRKTTDNRKSPRSRLKPKKKFGTSKLEQDFAKDFLDKLGVDYVWQFEAKEIGRYFDYAVIENGSIILLEIDGGYWHSDPRVVNEDKLTPTQKHNKRVDEYKNKWALEHGFPIIRIWELDIRNNPKKVMKMLRERLNIETNKRNKIIEKNKRHNNVIK